MKSLEDLEKNVKYLLNSHHEMILAMKKNNDGLMEMNIFLRGLISYLNETIGRKNNE